MTPANSKIRTEKTPATWTYNKDTGCYKKAIPGVRIDFLALKQELSKYGIEQSLKYYLPGNGGTVVLVNKDHFEAALPRNVSQREKLPQLSP